MTDRDIEIAMDRVTGRVWDETKCRVCGVPLGSVTFRCTKDYCGWNPGGKRADDPLPHTTSYEQMAMDREMLTDEQWDKFIENLLLDLYYDGETPPRITYYACRLLMEASLPQQCIAYLRACGVEVEG